MKSREFKNIMNISNKIVKNKDTNKNLHMDIKKLSNERICEHKKEYNINYNMELYEFVAGCDKTEVVYCTDNDTKNSVTVYSRLSMLSEKELEFLKDKFFDKCGNFNMSFKFLDGKNGFRIVTNILAWR